MGRLIKDVDNFGPLPPLPPLLPRNWDAVLLNENFAEGMNGWHTHTTSCPPSLSDHAFGRSSNSLQLSTGMATGVEFGGTQSIYKRLGVLHDSGYILTLAWLAFRGKGEHASPRSVGIFNDHQMSDNTGRSFNRLVMRRYVGSTTGTETFSPRWSITPDQIPVQPPATAYVDVPNSGAAQWPAVPGAGAIPGWNVNHGDYFLAAMVVSLNQSENQTNPKVGIGRYWRAYMGERAFDLSTLKAGGTWTDDGTSTNTGIGTTTGSGAENPQTDINSGSLNAASDFANGYNVGFSVSNKLNGPDGISTLHVGHVFAAHYPNGTQFPLA